MSEYIHMKHGDDEKISDVMALLNKSFGFETEHDKFENLIPKLYKPMYKPASNNVVLDVNGEMRAAVGLYYNSLTICGEKIKTAGIGNVAVLPEYRNNGYMSFCMAYCLDEMKQNMTDLSFLSGKRHRYARFSYEPAGIKYDFTLYKKEINSSKILKSALLTEKDCSIFEKITKIYNSKNFKAERNSEAMYDILKTWHGVPYAFFDENEFAGWVVFNSDYTCIYEFGYSDEKFIEDIFASVFAVIENNSVFVSSPPFDEPLCKYLGIHSEYYKVSHPDHYTILCFENVIRAFLKLKATYSKLSDGECIMLIEGEKLPEQLKISVCNNNITVEECNGKPDICLNHQEAMRLVGSLYSERRKELKAECQSWFPLPLYTYSQDNV